MTGAERWLRRLVNPATTAATAWWCDSALRMRLLRQRARHAQAWRSPSLPSGPSGADLAGSGVRDAVPGVPASGTGSRPGGPAGR
jgi:hypothetical protein